MKRWIQFATLCTFLIPGFALANGTAIEGDAPSWTERVILLLTNEARTDPQEALKNCTVCAEKACYTQAQPPVFWSHNLARAARFHSANLYSAGCFDHDSPCKLKANIADLYPSQCDGSTSCACEGEVQCNTGTGTFERIALFGTSGASENIAMGRDEPRVIFNMWLLERETSSACKISATNGHRYTILTGGRPLVGVGVENAMSTQDFGRGAQQTGFSSGIHYPNKVGNVDFKVHYYSDSAELNEVNLHIIDECKAMSLSRGNKKLGVFLLTLPMSESCVAYAFEGVDSGGQNLRYPAHGQLLFNCGDKVWEDVELPACKNDDVTPPDDGTNPPDDGTNPPDDGTNPPDDGTNPPDDGTNPPDDGTNPPDDGTNPPDDGTNPPDDGTNPPDDGTNPPDDGTNPPGDAASSKGSGDACSYGSSQHTHGWLLLMAGFMAVAMLRRRREPML